MSVELRDLYQEMILDHNRRPHNFHAMEEATHRAEGYNPLCGDKVTIYLKIQDDLVVDVSFEGAGCAISTASASLLTETLKGMTVAQAEALFEKFHQMLTRDSSLPIDEEEMGKLVVFAGVSEYPTRVKCATLAWHTLLAALKNEQQPVSTE